MATVPSSTQRALVRAFPTDEGTALADSVTHQAAALAIMMKAIHGGAWMFSTDHETGFILIRRRDA